MSHEELELAGPTDCLGVIVHGPTVLARATGIAVGLRCVFGYPSGLELLVVLRATGVQAEAAARDTFGGAHRRSRESWASSRSLLSVEVDGRLEPIHPLQQGTSSGDDAFDLESTYWLSPLPRDDGLSLVVGWPEAGLPEHRLRLVLTELDDLSARVLPFL